MVVGLVRVSELFRVVGMVLLVVGLNYRVRWVWG